MFVSSPHPEVPPSGDAPEQTGTILRDAPAALLRMKAEQKHKAASDPESDPQPTE
jgi:hypothetical protein